MHKYTCVRLYTLPIENILAQVYNKDIINQENGGKKVRTFEIGKRYGDNAVVFEIVKRTAKTITYAAIHHPGRYNESRREEKKVKIQNWDGREVFFAGSETVEA